MVNDFISNFPKLNFCNLNYIVNINGTVGAQLPQ